MADPKQPGGEKLEGRYANVFRIGFNAYEFVLDFGQCYVEQEKEQMHTRIVTSPSSARDLSDLLKDSLCEHEEKYKPGDGES